MKTAALATTLFLLGTGASLAGAGAPVPEGSQTPPPSGRPSAALDDAKCEGVRGLTVQVQPATGSSVPAHVPLAFVGLHRQLTLTPVPW